MVNKKIDRYEVMLRRILGFYQKLEDLSIQQSQVAKNVDDLHTLAFPNDDENLPAAEDDDVDETGTQYDNDQRYDQRLGDGPAPTLFPSPEPSSEIPSTPVPSASFTMSKRSQSQKVTAAPSARWAQSKNQLRAHWAWQTRRLQAHWAQMIRVRCRHLPSQHPQQSFIQLPQSHLNHCLKISDLQRLR